MPIYLYKATGSDGRKKSGRIVGLSENEVAAKLRKQEIEAYSVINVTDTLETKISLALNRIRTKDVVIFARQFSVMIAANVPIVESLIILVDQTERLALRNMVAEIAFEVDSGSFLSDAMAKRPKVFSDFFVNIVRSGETSGKLDEVLNYLADEMEKNYDMIAKIKGAMIYPVFIICGLIIVSVVLMVYVIPNLTSVLTESSAKLPFSTRVVIGVSNFFKDYLWLLGLILIGLAVGLRAYLKTYIGKRQFDIIAIRMPILGKLFQYIYLMRFTRSLSTLLKGGVTITKSLEITAAVISNTIYKELILDTLQAINDGNPMASVMERSKDVPMMVPQMISVGEKTGRLDSVLDRVTDFYGRETANMLANLTTLMEPIILVVMGVGVGIMVSAVILPMYNLASQF